MLRLVQYDNFICFIVKFTFFIFLPLNTVYLWLLVSLTGKIDKPLLFYFNLVSYYWVMVIGSMLGGALLGILLSSVLPGANQLYQAWVALGGFTILGVVNQESFLTALVDLGSILFLVIFSVPLVFWSRKISQLLRLSKLVSCGLAIFSVLAVFKTLQLLGFLLIHV